MLALSVPGHYIHRWLFRFTLLEGESCLIRYAFHNMTSRFVYRHSDILSCVQIKQMKAEPIRSHSWLTITFQSTWICGRAVIRPQLLLEVINDVL